MHEAATAYGIAEMAVYKWMHKLGFEHLKGRLVYVKARTELDLIKELEAEVLRLKQSLADEVLDHKLDEAFLRIACQRTGTTVEDLKNCAKGEIVFQDGLPANRFAIVLSGSVHIVRYSEEGRGSIEETISAGGLVGAAQVCASDYGRRQRLVRCGRPGSARSDDRLERRRCSRKAV